MGIFCLRAVGAFWPSGTILLVARRAFITSEFIISVGCLPPLRVVIIFSSSPPLVARLAFCYRSNFTMGDAASPLPLRPTSPVKRATTAGERDLVPVHGFSYAAPSGDYRGLHIVHVLGCTNNHPDFDNEVRHFCLRLDLRTFDAVEKVCFRILAACGCDSLAVAPAGCHVDRTTALGFYA